MSDLHEAVINNNYEEVVRLLDAGTALDEPDEYGFTPLFCAAQEGHTQVARLLLERGADKTRRAVYGLPEDRPYTTALALAAWMGHEDTVQLLLDWEVGTSPEELKIALYCALMDNGANTVPLLVQAGAQLSLRDAIILHEVETATRLVMDGADVNAPDEIGQTPLMLAAQYYSRGEIVRLLLDYGAEIDAQDKDGRTALMYAIGRWENYRLLLEAGANIHLQDALGETVFMQQLHNWNLSNLRDLIARGADFQQPDAQGETPMQRAEREGKKEVVHLLWLEEDRRMRERPR